MRLIVEEARRPVKVGPESGEGLASPIIVVAAAAPPSRTTEPNQSSIGIRANRSLTQAALNKTSGHLDPFEGLAELRYLHLDQLANVSALSADYCESSRKLASL